MWKKIIINMTKINYSLSIISFLLLVWGCFVLSLFDYVIFLVILLIYNFGIVWDYKPKFVSKYISKNASKKIIFYLLKPISLITLFCMINLDYLLQRTDGFYFNVFLIINLIVFILFYLLLAVKNNQTS